MFGGSKSKTYTYFAALMAALCQGPVAGVGKVWSDKNRTTLTDLKKVENEQK